MNGLMMNYQLTLPTILRRAEQLYPHKEIATRLPDRSVHRYAYSDFVSRAKKLSVVLKDFGIRAGERVATLCWNHHQHLEAYFGIPSAGAVLHTLNLRLHPDDLSYIVNHAGDRALFVDESLLPLYKQFADKVNLEHVIVVSESGAAPVGMHAYEELLEGADAGEFSYPEPDEKQAAAMCYTSGTTGRPKGVVYSHRALVLHSLGTLTVDAFALSEADVALPVVPMFHVNAWGIPFAAALAGAKQVFPGPYLDPASLLELFEAERVTFVAGVSTIWLGLLQLLDRHPDAYDLSSLRQMSVGGSAAPEWMIRGFQQRHGLRVVHGWGMTETSPVGTVAPLPSELREAPEDEQYRYRAKQGFPMPLVEIRIRGEEGIAPWDGESMGELEIRGPWVASEYYDSPESSEKFTEDGWLRTGDISTIDQRGYMEIKDRAKDLIKSGGEWISSVALENTLMQHEAVAEAAVIAVSHPKWQERPLAVVVRKEGASATQEELISYLEPRFARWWLPDAVEFVEEIPKTSVGKFKKSELRERFAQRALSGD
ncbi:MAG: long-chain fatty acid--CoA ligase [Chloroflexota bacterium]|jgi:fatty-acyl-CoA synthase|nr:long-chain fatty acid--CoA ligase [Chloroflexota bacterium]